MFEAGIIDPLKVARIALQNAVSVSSLLLTTEATVHGNQRRQTSNARYERYGWNGRYGWMM